MFPRNYIPNEFRCPITFEIMEDPVQMDDMNNYEKEAITLWMTEHSNISPVTKQPMSNRMRPNNELKSRIQQFLNNNSSNEQLQIMVKNLDDKYWLVNASKNDSVLHLREKIEKLTGIKVKDQVLIFKGHLLNDYDKMIKDYKIKNHNTINLVVRGIGGD